MRLQSHPIRTVRGARHFFTAARAVSGATLLRLVLLRTSRSFVRFSLPCTHARGHARIVNNASPSTLSWTPLFSWNTRNGKCLLLNSARVRSLLLTTIWGSELEIKWFYGNYSRNRYASLISMTLKCVVGESWFWFFFLDMSWYRKNIRVFGYYTQ